MDYQYIVAGGFIASTLVLLLLLFGSAAKKKKATCSLHAEEINKDCAKTSSENGTCPQQVVGATDIIIVGAGVAGAALAYTLGKDGRRVHVIERDLNEPDRIVGELLQPGGYLKLTELGLQDCVDEIDAQEVYGYVVYNNGKYTKISYPLDKFGSHLSGRSFHNGRFIQRMRHKAVSIPNVKLEQGTVTSLLEENGIIKGVHYKTKGGEELIAKAPLTIVCDGCFSNLSPSLCNPKVDVASHFVSMVLEKCNLPHANHGHVIFGDPSPFMFYPISSTEIRCFVDVPGPKLPSLANGDMANYFKTVVAPQVPRELHKSFIEAVEKGKMRSMPSRSMPASPSPKPGALLLGDALNMRHPLTGAGMTVALSDILLLTNLLRPLNHLHDASSLCTYLQSFYTLRKPVVSTFNILAGALYKVSCASSEPGWKEMQQACFEYLSLGGVYSDGLIALLAAVNPSPFRLLLNFFAMAIYGVARLFIPFPSPKRIWMVTRLISGATGIIFPIIKAEGVGQMFFPATVAAYYKTPPTN